MVESRLRYAAERAEVELVSDASEGPYAGVHRFAALEFLARLVDHIPAKGEVRAARPVVCRLMACAEQGGRFQDRTGAPRRVGAMRRVRDAGKREKAPLQGGRDGASLAGARSKFLSVVNSCPPRWRLFVRLR